VESYGALILDLEDTDNDSLPIIFSPQPGNSPQTVPSPKPQSPLSPQPQPVTVTVPQPEINPVPAVNPAPETNPVPAVNPISPDVSPAELNPSPFIIVPVSTPNDLIPVPGVFQEPSPAPVTSLLPVPEDVVFDSTGNFTIWLHVISVPMKFQVTILDDDENIPYTDNANGPCMPTIEYWKDSTVGCPCDGNWFGDGTYNHSISMGGREIVPDQCPNSCPETFYINDTLLYGNVRLNVTVYENGTIMNKTLEITRLSAIKEIGYAFGAGDIVYVYKLATKNSTVDEPNPAQTPSPEELLSPEVNEPETQDNNSGTSPRALATTVTMIFVFLLMMYENTQ
jgi:hypothetical protein